MREIIIATLRRLQDEKVKNRIIPDHVMFPDLMQVLQTDIREELNEMARDGTIIVINTVNSKGIKLV